MIEKLKKQLSANHTGDLIPEHVDEISKRLNVKKEEVISMNRRLHGKEKSLNDPIKDEDGTEWQDWIVDKEMDQELKFAQKEEMNQRKDLLKDSIKILNEREKDVLKATVSWPFYSGGKKRVTVSKNESLKTRKRLLLDNVIKTNDTIVATAWANLQSSKSFLDSTRLQVGAAEIANEGITAEYERGSGRTTLDVIQSNTLLLNAKVSLANSERNYLLAQYNLLKVIGLLNSNYLKLK